MPNDGDAQILQILRREAGKELFRNSVLAESGVVLFKAKAPQPDHHVHDGAQTQGCPHIIVQPGEGVQDA